ncbi:N-acetylmuramoyl-L-alanine amidase family protein [Niallia endozanthoxylica]|uniref:N-acetylmuramoyl-L-alanine amidase n=1 Tax=Niallia endozanthoxylica TaxID=2036016 RepID=A0A5J5GUG5_9BACI|nr:N-acetylmuramoyl-L-alanine amidase [Niallia endozanthoxylica]KAA9011880.1 N-acetylmuramoyl-L-alanine amidase [Niallia endozanthoxylica]
MFKLFLDPGHGGSDPGAVGNEIQEKDITLSISKVIQETLASEYSDVEVKMSRTGDTFPSLSQRTNEANKWGADFFLSIHINAGGGTGFESFVYPNVGVPTTTYQNIIHDEIMKVIGLNNRGKRQSDLHILRESNMPSLLTESGFIDNPFDAGKMKDPNWIQAVGRAHVKGLERAFNLQRKNPVYDVIIPNLSFWQARALVPEYEQRGYNARGVALKNYGPNEAPSENDPYQLVITTDYENAKNLVIEFKRRGYDRTYGQQN